MSDAIREAFEKWYAREFKRLPNNDGHETYIAWEAWQAALQHSGEAVAWCFTDVNGKPKELVDHPKHKSDQDMRIYTPLYTTPHPVVDVNQQLVEALRACEECLMFINGGEPLSVDVPLKLAREALLSASKGGE